MSAGQVDGATVSDSAAQSAHWSLPMTPDVSAGLARRNDPQRWSAEDVPAVLMLWPGAGLRNRDPATHGGAEGQEEELPAASARADPADGRSCWKIGYARAAARETVHGSLAAPSLLMT